MAWAVVLLQAAAIAVSLSIDAFATSFAYGCKKIKIPMLSVHIINFICTLTLGLSFFFGGILLPYIPAWLAAGLAFAILFTIGVIKLFDSITKSIIRTHTQLNKEIKVSLFNFKLLLRLYADPEVADFDISKNISPREAALLAISLSLDGFAVGFSAVMIGINGWALISFALIANVLALLFGGWLGNQTANKLRFNISWAAGVVLIALALMQLT